MPDKPEDIIVRDRKRRLEKNDEDQVAGERVQGPAVFEHDDRVYHIADDQRQYEVDHWSEQKTKKSKHQALFVGKRVFQYFGKIFHICLQKVLK